MVTIGSVPETSGDKSLGDAEDSDDAYSCIMMEEEAGGLLCSLTGMLKIHLSDSSIEVNERSSKLYVCTVQRSGVQCSISRFYLEPWLRERDEEFSLSNHTLNFTRKNQLHKGNRSVYIFCTAAVFHVH